MSIEMMRQRIAQLQKEIDFHRSRLLSLLHKYHKRDLLQGHNPQTPKAWKALANGIPLPSYPIPPEERKILQQLQNEVRLLVNEQKQVNRYLVEIHKKYSIPAACIIFVLVGAPLGVMARRGGWTVGLGIGFVFFLIYWAFLIGGEKLADRGIIPPFWAMWAPNIFIGSVGIYLIIQTVRETTFIRWQRFALFRPRAKEPTP